MNKPKSHLTVTLLVALMIQLFSTQSFAQSDQDLDGLVKDTKNDLLTVIGGGLAGAVLGLSTLSFVEEPKEHTNNIVIGASLGIIAGVAYVAFSQANKTQDMLYGEEGAEAAANFNTTNRKAWHSESEVSQGLDPKLIEVPSFAVSFRY